MKAQGAGNALLSAPVLGGFTLGIALMYATALLVKI